ncbi:DcaP family trimeric outer membrane transporter [Flavobacterium sp.]|uniref:DcaP family trimeric outer membrane transporter n=1 Tax=Flavobacterium sp. TaxID=239 RepID=UPI002CB6FA64|nr:DcaP family trimeric outer membrane transporter [Flavobacterium sp.]HSD06606.1 DcaP family trimeric outer membrane transporter [Flavobacterium sp.]
MKKVTLIFLIITSFSYQLQAQDEASQKTMEINGWVMMDSGYDFGKMDPNWFDMMRPTKILDSNGNEFQNQGNVFFGVRQTALSFKNYFDTSLGTVKTVFEFDLVGSGKDAGATAFHLRHAYIQFGKFIIGQTNSVFADMDVYPNLIDFMGPNGAVFTRNIQIRYTPISTEHQTLAIALERPGATGDKGQYGEGFVYASLLDNVAFRFSVPDLSAEYRYTDKWGYLELAGILRSIKWEDNNTDEYQINGSTIGWGISLSTKVQLAKNIFFRGAFTTGAGVQNYMNDADADVGIKRQYNNTLTPITGVAIPIIAGVAYFDINWSPKLSTAFGYSIMDNKTTEAQLSTAYKTGQYASINLLYSPVNNLVLGPELQWGMRQNNDFAGNQLFSLPAATGNTGVDVKLQFSARYVFNNNFYKTNK